MEQTTTTQTLVRCIFSGDGAGAQARLNHRHKSPEATDLVYGVTSKPMPACMLCARAAAKDGYMVRPIKDAS